MFFLPTKSWKNHLKKLLTYGDWEFFFSAAPTAHNSPKLHFHFINYFIQPSRVGSLTWTIGSRSIIVKLQWFWCNFKMTLVPSMCELLIEIQDASLGVKRINKIFFLLHVSKNLNRWKGSFWTSSQTDMFRHVYTSSYIQCLHKYFKTGLV